MARPAQFPPARRYCAVTGGVDASAEVPRAKQESDPVHAVSPSGTSMLMDGWPVTVSAVAGELHADRPSAAPSRAAAPAVRRGALGTALITPLVAAGRR